SYQKTKIIDTTVIGHLTFLPGFVAALEDKVKNFFFNTNTPWQRQAIMFASSAIAESFRDMYQGELIVIGEPSIKPYDKMYIDDYYTRMTGNADVGRVIYHFRVETGFITSIKPEL